MEKGNEKKERLIKFLEYKGLSNSKFQTLMGLSNAYVTNSNPSRRIINKMGELFPELNTEWMFTGKGDMIKKKETPTAKNDKSEMATNGDNMMMEIIRKQQSQIDKLIESNQKKDEQIEKLLSMI